MCMMAEMCRDSKEQPQPFSPDMFHPMRKSPEKVSNVIPYNPEILKAIAGR